MAAFMKRCIQFLMFPALLVPIIISYVKKTMMQLFTGHYKNWGEWNKCVCLRRLSSCVCFVALMRMYNLCRTQALLRVYKCKVR